MKVEKEDESWRAECEKQYEQELWDNVAKMVFAKWAPVGASMDSISLYAKESIDAADAFMAERAKRMKERG